MSKEPLGQPHYLPLSTVYSYDPVPGQLRGQEGEKYILGAQGQLWSEYMKGPTQVEYFAFPRLCALAEVVWSRQDGRNFDNFMVRLKEHIQRLQQLKVNFRPLDS